MAGPTSTVCTLRQLLRSLDQLQEQHVIYAKRPWTLESETTCSDEDGAEPPLGLDYLLEVTLVHEVAQVWSAWRGGRQPSTDELGEAVIHYAEHDAYLPAG